MTTPSEEYALLLAAASAVDAELAKELLESEGIPVLFHGQDRAFLASAESPQMSPPDVFVPKTALDKAVAILRRTWADFEPPQ